MNLDQKKEIVEDLHDRFSRAQIVIATDYKGLDVESMTILRRQLQDEDIEYKVVKNTLLARASMDTSVETLKDHFKGPCAIAISYTDPVAPAKILTKFAETQSAFEIKMGVLNGQIIDEKRIKDLSALPSREVLLSQFLGLLNNVPGGFVRTLNAIPGGFVNVLQAIKDQKDTAE